MIGRVSNIQRYSMHDGYGIRTVVFLLGCDMRCVWCQNPETLCGNPAVMVVADNCVGCGACVSVCPSGASRWDNGKVILDRSLCESCFKCVDACYFDARKKSGEKMDVDECFREIMKDEVFFRRSNGGVTLSGGEPLLQSEFSMELLKKLKTVKIHTAIETAGHVLRCSFEKVLEYTDLFLYDVKFFDSDKHLQFTCVDNELILDNLRWLTTQGKEIIVRVPLIPGINDGEEFDAIVNLTASLDGIKELHILPYHSLGQSKYDQLGLICLVDKLNEENDVEVERCRLYAENKGLRVSVGGSGFKKATD